MRPTFCKTTEAISVKIVFNAAYVLPDIIVGEGLKSDIAAQHQGTLASFLRPCNQSLYEVIAHLSCALLLLPIRKCYILELYLLNNSMLSLSQRAGQHAVG